MTENVKLYSVKCDACGKESLIAETDLKKPDCHCLKPKCLAQFTEAAKANAKLVPFEERSKGWNFP
jgi:hypothetical protein